MKATTKGKTKQSARAADWRSPGSPDDLDPTQQLAHSIVRSRPDLMPSVDRIMRAGLPGDGCLQALGLFNDALTTPGDPNRDPRVAIAQFADQGEPV